MERIYFTITGTKHYYGSDFLERGMRVYLNKEPDNEMDAEAIQVRLPGLGTIGYVANSTYTVLGESMSAGRLYDRIEESAEGEILYVLERGAVCVLIENEKCDIPF